MSWLSWRTERWLPRRSFLVVSSENHRSTRFSHELLVGVKCSWSGLGEQPAFDRRRLVGGGVVEDEVNVEVFGDLCVDGLQELPELDRAMAGVQPADHLSAGEIQRGVEARRA